MNNCLDCKKAATREHKRCRKCYLIWLSISSNNHNYKHPERMIGTKNPNYKGGKNRCKICDRLLNDRSANLCQKCYLSNQTGKNNANWNGGISNLPYSFEFNSELKTFIREKYGYICQLCDSEGKTVHHIDYDKSNSKENNLFNLCSKCNSKVNFNRDYWYAYFVYLKENNG